jgi:hypothetical protein
MEHGRNPGKVVLVAAPSRSGLGTPGRANYHARLIPGV